MKRSIAAPQTEIATVLAHIDIAPDALGKTRLTFAASSCPNDRSSIVLTQRPRFKESGLTDFDRPRSSRRSVRRAAGTGRSYSTRPTRPWHAHSTCHGSGSCAAGAGTRVFNTANTAVAHAFDVPRLCEPCGRGGTLVFDTADTAVAQRYCGEENGVSAANEAGNTSAVSVGHGGPTLPLTCSARAAALFLARRALGLEQLGGRFGSFVLRHDHR